MSGAAELGKESGKGPECERTCEVTDDDRASGIRGELFGRQDPLIRLMAQALRGAPEPPTQVLRSVDPQRTQGTTQAT